MANILFISPNLPYPLHSNGLTVRVLPLHQELSKRHHCFLAAFSHDDAKLSTLQGMGIYEDIVTFSERECSSPKKLRRLFFSGNLDRVARPNIFRQISNKLQEYIEDHRIEVVVAHTLGILDYLDALKDVCKILDDIDCQTLLFERQRSVIQKRLSVRENLINQFLKIRAAYQEQQLGWKFDAVTTASPVDRARLCKLNFMNSRSIVAVPNGVSREIIEDYSTDDNPESAAIAFWGALDFPPNATAIEFFYREVFNPYLKNVDIKWFIIGGNANKDMIEIADRHPNIILTGFVQDLKRLVLGIPVTINPMVIGGGLKNKVIEAFAMRRLVISNALGMESIPEAENGKHFVHAETPRQMADAIISSLGKREERRRIGEEARKLVERNYTWSIAGDKYCEIVDTILALTQTKKMAMDRR